MGVASVFLASDRVLSAKSRLQDGMDGATLRMFVANKGAISRPYGRDQGDRTGQFQMAGMIVRSS